MAVAGHADAERPHVGCIPPVASSTPLAELPLVAIGALAPLHPRREDAGSGLCRHQGDVVNVAGAVLPEGGSDPEGCQVSQQPAVFKVVQPGAPLAAWVLIQPEGVGLADTTGQDLPRGQEGGSDSEATSFQDHVMRRRQPSPSVQAVIEGERLAIAQLLVPEEFGRCHKVQCFPSPRSYEHILVAWRPLEFGWGSVLMDTCPSFRTLLEAGGDLVDAVILSTDT